MRQCNTGLSPAAGDLQHLNPATQLDKASAILGGRASRLEQIRRQQSDSSAGLTAATPVSGLTQVSSTSPLAQSSCTQLILPSAANPGFQLGVQQKLPGPDDFLASKRLRVQHTAFDGAWDRVQHQGLPRGIAAGLSRMTSGSANLATLAAVNSWANARIRYVEDKVLYGKADYWASAGTTLRRRAGDCEDIAIAKLQLLASLGVARSDMYLTVARDLARKADHAVLIVRMDGRNWLLDNSTNQLLDASRSYDYQPILSFSASGKWLHGYSRL